MERKPVTQDNAWKSKFACVVKRAVFTFSARRELEDPDSPSLMHATGIFSSSLLDFSPRWKAARGDTRVRVYTALDDAHAHCTPRE